ncbi:hypothetical protein JOB18_011776 [Solea senegalensis]|uniref:Uncharacterized protein n=1 Tax=Solea senegalensis TaxID=28829 RepID=A0AAV6QLL1_SOLSE|nr:hypothetical protein JOB18_011776 [Solea senegalensis]
MQRANCVGLHSRLAPRDAPPPRGLIWEFTGASRISLRHISLKILHERLFTGSGGFYASEPHHPPSADRICNRFSLPRRKKEICFS